MYCSLLILIPTTSSLHMLDSKGMKQTSSVLTAVPPRKDTPPSSRRSRQPADSIGGVESATVSPWMGWQPSMQIQRCGEHHQLPVTSNGTATLDAGPEVSPELCMPASPPPPSLPHLHMYLLPLIAAPASLVCRFVQFHSPVAPLAPLIPLHFVLFANHANHTNCTPRSPSHVIYRHPLQLLPRSFLLFFTNRTPRSRPLPCIRPFLSFLHRYLIFPLIYCYLTFATS